MKIVLDHNKAKRPEIYNIPATNTISAWGSNPAVIALVNVGAQYVSSMANKNNAEAFDKIIRTIVYAFAVAVGIKYAVILFNSLQFIVLDFFKIFQLH
jgi:hypothetical protein